jgi:murein L,D-transpeptidase YcbB/YkuD
LAAVVVATLLAIGCPGDGVLRGDDTPAGDGAVAAAIRAILDGDLPRPVHAAAQEDLQALYGPSAAPLWIRSGRPTGRAAEAVALLEGAAAHGLEPEDHRAAALRAALSAALRGAGAGELARLDVTLSAETLRFLRAIHGGRVRPAEAGFAYHVDLEGAEFGARLRATLAAGRGVDALRAQLTPPFAQYARLERALARERARPADAEGAARVRKIVLALERLRWLPHAGEGPIVVANVPAFRLVAFRSPTDERPALEMAIVVGRAARTQTPLFAGEMTHVLFRPPWYPPPSILRTEIVPRLARDPGYLRRERMDLVAVNAGDSSPALPATAENLRRLRAGQLAVRQRPGPQNSLGLVKFVFPNDYTVYMHDTPARGLFARERRDFSHGCIRVERPAALAEFVLSREPGWTAPRIAEAMNGGRTRRAEVAPPIPVFIFYTTAIVRADDTVLFFDDVYGLDARLERALAAEGGR